MSVSQVIIKKNCHAFAVKFQIAMLTVLLALAGCANSADVSFPIPVTPPDVAPPFDEQLAERELTDENAADTDQHSDDELMEFEPGLGTDEAALSSAFFTGSEDLCAATFAQLGGTASINNKQVDISWCRNIAAKLPIPLTAADESIAHAAGWNDTRAAIFSNRSEICSKLRCIRLSNLPYPF